MTITDWPQYRAEKIGEWCERLKVIADMLDAARDKGRLSPETKALLIEQCNDLLERIEQYQMQQEHEGH